MQMPIVTQGSAVPPLVLEVWDHDDIGRDDRMGQAPLPLAQLLQESRTKGQPADISQWISLGTAMRTNGPQYGGGGLTARAQI